MASGITIVRLESPVLNEQGGTGTIFFSNSKVKFNDFGDAEVLQERETKQFEVTLKPIPVPDTAIESRRVFRLDFPKDRWENRLYYVWSPGIITASRLLIRSGEGKLVKIKITTEGNRMSHENVIGLAHILPDVGKIQNKGRAESEDLPNEISLRSFHFTSKLAGQTERNRQGYISIHGAIENELQLTHDLNHTSFNPFGDGVMSTMAAFGRRKFKATEKSVKDPVGLGRRLFHLEYQPRNPQIAPEEDPRRPLVDYSLVLAPKVDGPHRLIIRRLDKIRHVLPLYDLQWRNYQQKQVEIEAMPQEAQRAIAEIRRLAGNRFQFQIIDGKLSYVTFFRLENPHEVFSQLDQLSDLKHLSLGQCPNLKDEDWDPDAEAHTTHVIFYIRCTHF